MSIGRIIEREATEIITVYGAANCIVGVIFLTLFLFVWRYR